MLDARSALRLTAMSTPLAALLQTVRAADEREAEVSALAAELGVSPRTARACCRRLRALALALEAANDGAPATPDDAWWLSSLRLGARLLTVEAEPAVADAASRVLALLDGEARPEAPARRVTDAELRSMVARAVTERRVLAIEYWNPDQRERSAREVEPLSLSNVDGHWTFLAFCRTRMDLRSFRFDRVHEARVTERYFEPRQGLSLERFIHRQKNLTRQRLAG